MSGKSRKSRQRARNNSSRTLMAEAIENAHGVYRMDISSSDLHTLIRQGWATPTPDGKSWCITKSGRDAHNKGIN
ncbi:hypothetical protein SNOUR_43895 [Streptomyces noursei ATCC 11455]|uniref:hypothetical protein n=1 Tax=Streptomyces noursei TaxID=1971 RepID=UPI00081C87C8|nr:hypothetical protein SNOUR_00055 [Streptomyces noursei ATCC 11455]ANZ22001.1 hypothetical protein SNOUR_43895 [Streptomyces noursei ATCC 11455]